MRKNINKLVAFAIGVSVISGSVIPVFAVDTTTQNTITVTGVQAQTIGKPVLTLDDAIKAAVSNSETLALADKKISYQNKINDANEELADFNGVSGEQEDFNDDTRNITLNQLKQKRDFDEDKLMQKTTKAYNNIVTSQMKIDKAKMTLEIKSKEVNDANLKKSLGLITSIDLKSTELTIESLKNEQKSNDNKLKDLQESFKVLTGKDVTQYSLEQDIKYEPFKINSSVDEYLDNAIDKYLKYNEQLIKLNKDYYTDDDNKFFTSSTSSGVFTIDNLIDDDKIEGLKTAAEAAKDTGTPKYSSDVDGDGVDDVGAYKAYVDKLNYYNAARDTYTGTLALKVAYLSTKLGIYENETNLNENKKLLKEQLRTTYTNLIATEDSINILKKNIELNNKQLSNAKLKNDLGMTTKSEYNTQIISSEELKLQLRSLIDAYNNYKEQIEKPWIAFS